MQDNEESYIAALDVGTTTIRCHIINSKAELISQSSTSVRLHYPENGFVEINPDDLYEDIIFVIKDAIQKAGIFTNRLTCLGIGTQRATFITWRKDNGKPFHNFITWKDLRSKLLVKQWNCSISMKSFRFGAYLAYLVSRSRRFLAASSLMLASTQTTLRLLWVLNNIPELQCEVRKNNVMFGTVETWILYKLTKGRTYVSDYTNASATGLFDPFVLSWSSWTKIILGIPHKILPPVVSNDFNFGVTEKEIFGCEIPIKCVIADQQASMFGSCCFSSDILKVTLGTGGFLDLKTEKPHGSTNGVYPLVFSGLKDRMSYMVEGACNDCGSLIKWAMQIGLVDDVSKTSSIAQSVDSSDGIYFIPAFSGLGPPISDEKAASGFLGVKPTSKKEHMVRAILESIVYRIVLLFNIFLNDVKADIKKIYVDGGVSKNDFVCQMLADMTDLPVERPNSEEMSVMGIAFLSGLNSGVWKDVDHITQFRQTQKIFFPNKNHEVKLRYIEELEQWKNVVERFASWYS